MPDSQKQPLWMQDPLVRDIPAEKLELLQKLVLESSRLSRRELLPFLMALARRRDSARPSFSIQERDAIIAAIRRHATPEEAAKMDQALRLMGGG